MTVACFICYQRAPHAVMRARHDYRSAPVLAICMLLIASCNQTGFRYTHIHILTARLQACLLDHVGANLMLS